MPTPGPIQIDENVRGIKMDPFAVSDDPWMAERIDHLPQFESCP